MKRIEFKFDDKLKMKKGRVFKIQIDEQRKV